VVAVLNTSHQVDYSYYRKLALNCLKLRTFERSTCFDGA
jgi:hypothetical protein